MRMRINTHLPDHIEETAKGIVDAVFRVHKSVGPGLLESVYEKCLIYELEKHGYSVKSQLNIPFLYDSKNLDLNLRIDLLVEDSIIIELKAVENLIPLYHAQLISYLKLTNKPLGFLINCNVPRIKDGIQRVIL